MLFKQNIFFYILVGFVFLICLKIYYESDAFQLKCIIASKDGNRYCVRERSKLEPAANLLASVTQRCKDLVKYMEENHSNDDRVLRLVSGFNPK